MYGIYMKVFLSQSQVPSIFTGRLRGSFSLPSGASTNSDWNFQSRGYTTQLKGDVGTCTGEFSHFTSVPYYRNWIDKMDSSVLAIVVNAEKRVVDIDLMKYKIVKR